MPVGLPLTKAWLVICAKLDEYIEELKEKLEQVKQHHFIAKSQSEYLKVKKEELKNSECIIIGDFSENYSFTVQDEVQSFHWDNSQCTLHPFVIYYKADQEVKCHSVCVMSDSLTHDTATVFAFQKAIMPEVKKLVKQLEKIIYFSDGCPGQYKNYPMFNLRRECPSDDVKADSRLLMITPGPSCPRRWKLTLCTIYRFYYLSKERKKTLFQSNNKKLNCLGKIVFGKIRLGKMVGNRTFYISRELLREEIYE